MTSRKFKRRRITESNVVIPFVDCQYNWQTEQIIEKYRDSLNNCTMFEKKCKLISFFIEINKLKSNGYSPRFGRTIGHSKNPSARHNSGGGWELELEHHEWYSYNVKRSTYAISNIPKDNLHDLINILPIPRVLIRIIQNYLQFELDVFLVSLS